MSTAVAPHQRGSELDELHGLMRAVARWLFLAGCTAVSVMVARVGSATAGDLLILASAGLVVLTPWRTWIPRGRGMSWVATSMAIILLGGLLATLASAAPSQSFLVLARMGILVVLLPWLLKTLFPSESGMRTVLVATGLGGALNGIATIAQMALGVEIPGAQVSTADRFSGLAGHVSDTGAICGLGVVIGFALLGRHAWNKQDVGAALILLLSLVGAILSGSVAGMIAAVLGCLVVACTRGISRGKLLWSVGACAVGGAVGTFLVSLTSNGLSPVDRLLQVLGLQTKYAGTNTSESRMVTIERGWTEFGRRPWTGIGLDNNAAAIYQDLPVHNLPVALLHVGGFFFAAGVLAVVAGQVGALVREWPARVAPATLGMIAAMSWFALTAPGYYNRYFWIPVAIAGAAGECTRARREGHLS